MEMVMPPDSILPLSPKVLVLGIGVAKLMIFEQPPKPYQDNQSSRVTSTFSDPDVVSLQVRFGRTHSTVDNNDYLKFHSPNLNTNPSFGGFSYSLLHLL